jgi:hypothetical protein
MKKVFFLVFLLSLFLVFDVFAKSGGGSGGRGSGGRGSYGGRSTTGPANPSKSFNPYHQEFNPTIPPAENRHINRSPYFSPNYIPFNPTGRNDSPKRDPLYEYNQNFEGRQH